MVGLIGSRELKLSAIEVLMDAEYIEDQDGG